MSRSICGTRADDDVMTNSLNARVRNKTNHKKFVVQFAGVGCGLNAQKVPASLATKQKDFKINKTKLYKMRSTAYIKRVIYILYTYVYIY